MQTPPRGACPLPALPLERAGWGGWGFWGLEGRRVREPTRGRGWWGQRGVQRDERFLTEAPPPFLLFSTPDLWQRLPDSEEGRKVGSTSRVDCGDWKTERKNERGCIQASPPGTGQVCSKETGVRG